MENNQEQWEKIRAQFDALPYPNHPLDITPKEATNYLAAHNSVIPYYLRDCQVVDTRGKWILDAGCGSGFKLQALAAANPGAHIVGIDISQKSIELAQKRLEYHDIKNPAEFYCIPIEELPSIERTFDYINCDEVLYLLADPVAGLKAMKAVLKPDGIIRVNMHSVLQRARFYRVQEFFAHFGCLEGTPSEEEMSLTRQTMTSLQDWVITKQQTWKPEFETDDERLLANCLLRGDKGITVPDFFALLRQASLEFISMVNWRQWNLEELFKNIEELPISVALGIADMSLEEQLHLFELLHPFHRLLDLYCGHPGQGKSRPPVADWSDTQWHTATVYLHPQLCTATIRKLLQAGASALGMIALDKYLKIDGKPFSIDASIASCLYPLLDSPQPMSALVNRWLQVRPLDMITLETANSNQAFETVKEFLTNLEDAGYVLLELAEA
ncbi:MAG: class I SAM-dependent methyltransferase [Cyanobacteria bacterium J06638_28]